MAGRFELGGGDDSGRWGAVGRGYGCVFAGGVGFLRALARITKSPQKSPLQQPPRPILKKTRNKSDSFVENISEACVMHASALFTTTRRSPRSRAGLMR